MTITICNSLLESSDVIQKLSQEISKFMCEAKLLSQMRCCYSTKLQLKISHLSCQNKCDSQSHLQKNNIFLFESFQEKKWPSKETKSCPNIPNLKSVCCKRNYTSCKELKMQIYVKTLNDTTEVFCHI